MIWSLIVFLVIGLVAGWLAGQLTKGSSFGLLGNLVVGVVGAILGGLVIWLLGYKEQNIVAQIITATGGAILFLFLLRKLRRQP